MCTCILDCAYAQPSQAYSKSRIVMLAQARLVIWFCATECLKPSIAVLQPVCCRRKTQGKGRCSECVLGNEDLAEGSHMSA